MNSLSWLIYFIQVSDSMRSVAGGVLFFGGLGCVVLVIAHIGCAIDNTPPATWVILKTLRRWAVGIMTVAVLVTVFMPARHTLILIAGSEIGERVVTSEAVATAKRDILDPSIDLLRVWIKDETAKIGERATERSKKKKD